MAADKIDGGLDRLASITIVNTLPLTLLSAVVLEQMTIRNRGVIINVASSAGLRPVQKWAAYSASKVRDYCL